MIARLVIGRSQGETYLEVEGGRITNLSFYRWERKDGGVIAFEGAVKEIAVPSRARPMSRKREDEESG